MNTDVLTTTVADRIAVVTLGSAKRIYFDAEMGDVLTEALEGFLRREEDYIAEPLIRGPRRWRPWLKLIQQRPSG